MTKYNNTKHTTIEMTPVQTIQPENSTTVQDNIRSKGKSNRSYPGLKVGDRVKIIRKQNLHCIRPKRIVASCSSFPAYTLYALLLEDVKVRRTPDGRAKTRARNTGGFSRGALHTHHHPTSRKSSSGTLGAHCRITCGVLIPSWGTLYTIIPFV